MQIEKGSKFYFFGTHCAKVTATVELAVFISETEQEAVLKVVSENPCGEATMVALISANPKNTSQPVIRLKSIIQNSFADTDDNDNIPGDFWDSLFSSTTQFLLSKRAAYYRYCRTQVKQLESAIKEENLKFESNIQKMKNQIQEWKENFEDETFLFNFAAKYGMVGKTAVLDDQFSAQSSKRGDTVFSHVSLYGVHAFTIVAIDSESEIVAIEGLNKYTSEIVQIKCVKSKNGLIPFYSSASEHSAHWYLINGDLSSLDSFVVRWSLKDAIKDSVFLNLQVLKGNLEKLENEYKVQSTHNKKLMSSLSENLKGLDSFIRSETM